MARSNPTVLNITRFIKQGDMVSAYYIYEHINRTDPAKLIDLSTWCFNSLLNAVITNKYKFTNETKHSHRMRVAVDMLRLMDTLGVNADFNTYAIALIIYGQLGDVDALDKTYSLICDRGYNVNTTFIISRMCKAYIIGNREKKGLMYFSQLLSIDNSIRTYNFLLSAYSKVNNENAILETMKKITQAGLKPNAITIAIVSAMYLKNGNYTAVQEYISRARSDGIEMNQRLFNIQMRASNALCDHKATLLFLKEIYAAKILPHTSTINEGLIAHAGLGNWAAVWSYYLTLCKTHSVHKSSMAAIAKALGPLKEKSSLYKLKEMVRSQRVPFRSILFDLMLGYAIKGDAASIFILIDQFQTTFQTVPFEAYHCAILAHYNSKDADACLAYAKSLEEKNLDIKFSLWYTVLLCMMRYKPEKVDWVKEHIQFKYPEILIEDSLEKARRLIESEDERDIKVVFT
ncbi:hypothetical protein BDEG_26837 [Batrachochytrium dendrobatidis JEL423]|uniref:Pentacotripeptide-repeat region of PRORP domain-containing protein n=1 Tax=Batrachochytrium dendrobatidis (strain JEL423) TaxID=403673 RepID=A0A177WTL8_BATDL|nr:hypothetical protein BDEG_26837 [Batrachochytrium dendrobatidis JEL423]